MSITRHVLVNTALLIGLCLPAATLQADEQVTFTKTVHYQQLKAELHRREIDLSKWEFRAEISRQRDSTANPSLLAYIEHQKKDIVRIRRLLAAKALAAQEDAPQVTRRQYRRQ